MQPTKKIFRGFFLLKSIGLTREIIILDHEQTHTRYNLSEVRN
jgi:hypothetical protein